MDFQLTCTPHKINVKGFFSIGELVLQNLKQVPFANSYLPYHV